MCNEDGIAILAIAYMNTDAYVVRTRNLEELNELDIVIDIGGGEFDHHIAGFHLCRATGEKYASAGLVWKNFAEKAIKNVMVKESISLNDNAFSRVESFVIGILEEIIKDKAVQVATKKELQKRYEDINDGILEIPAQTMPWLEDVVNYNESHNHSVKFVIFPYPAGGWAAQSVPPSMERKFDKLVPFPKKWAGGNEKTLPEISGIQDATFCHNGRFFARSKTKESILKMCKIAITTN